MATHNKMTYLLWLSTSIIALCLGAFITVGIGDPFNLLYFLIIPAIYSAHQYENRVYIPVVAAIISFSGAVLILFSKGWRDDLIILAATAFVLFIACEYIHRNVVLRKEAEDALRQEREQLQNRVDEQTADIKKTLENLKTEIANREQAESGLQVSEGKYQLLFNKCSDAIFIHGFTEDNLADRFVEVNDTACALLGYSREELLNLSPYDFINRNEKVGSEALQTLINKGSLVFTRELTAKSGRRITVEINSGLIEYEGQTLALSIARDISIHQRAAEALRKEKDRAQDFLDIAAVIMIVIGKDQKVQLINRRGCECLGLEAHEIVGKKWFDTFLPRQDIARAKTLFERVINGNASLPEYKVGRVINREGNERMIAWHNAYWKDENGNIIGVLSSGEDITEKRVAEHTHKQLEEQLRHAQKMEAVGHLAGGVAHDFNNLLQAILGYTEMAMREISPDTKHFHDLIGVQKAAERAGSLTRQLLTFSRRQTLDPVNLNLNTVIADVAKMLRRLIGEHIELNMSLGESINTVRADPGMLDQVLMNLCVNARDAMPRGGKIGISTENVTLDAGFCEFHAWAKAGDYVRMSVRDTGAGMTKEVLERIFEPFYTTKGEGKGTGLGLSLVYGIVKQHNGLIQVESQLDKGTVFSVYFPVVPINTEKEKNEKKDVSAPSGTETILVAEDEPLVLNLAARVLENHGYQVITAKDGEEAVKAFKENCQKIDLVILDVVMPKIGGREALEKCKSIKSDIKAVFCSGYDPATTDESFVPDKDTPFIRKPYTPVTLLQKVRKLLDMNMVKVDIS